METQVLDVVITPSFLTPEKVSLLEQKLQHMGEKVNVVGSIMIPGGVFEPRLQTPVDGTHVILDGQLSTENLGEVMDFVRQIFNPSASVYRTIYNGTPLQTEAVYKMR